MKEIIVTAIYAAIPISLFGMAAFLIYKDATGWGWFLFVVLLVVGNMRWSID